MVKLSSGLELLHELYQAKFDRLKEIATVNNIPKTGPLEVVRCRLIKELVLKEWDLSQKNIRLIKNNHLGEILGVFGLKKSGSIRERRQRLYLHLNHDPKQLTAENLDKMTKQQLHELCKILELPLTGDKQSLLVRVAGVLASQQGSWGKVKKSLKRNNSALKSKVVIPVNDEIFVDEEDPNKLNQSVESFVSQHPEGWTFEDESAFREELSNEGIETSRNEISNTIDNALRSATKETESDSEMIPPMNQSGFSEPQDSQVNLETEAALIEFKARTAEIISASRDFLTVSSASNEDDLNSFIDQLSNHGIPTEIEAVRGQIYNLVMELEFQIQNEKDAINSMPNSWKERESLREFENMRSSLRDQLNNTLALHDGDLVKARMAFEEIANSMGLDLRIPSVSGRLHALFDLHVELNEAHALQDPNIARRNRVLKILHHGSIHLTPSERRTIERLERNMTGFEQLVETVMESSEGTFSEQQQSLVIRFLESRGYEVNTKDIRPKVLAAAGIIGSELGFISPSEIPRIAPGVIISETEVDAIVTELKSLADTFRINQKDTLVDELLESEEDISVAVERVKSVKERIDHVDEVLSRLRG